MKNAFAANASPILSPASSRNSVLIPQIIEEAPVDTTVSSTYVRNSFSGFIRISFVAGNVGADPVFSTENQGEDSLVAIGSRYIVDVSEQLRKNGGPA